MLHQHRAGDLPRDQHDHQQQTEAEPTIGQPARCPSAPRRTGTGESAAVRHPGHADPALTRPTSAM